MVTFKLIVKSKCNTCIEVTNRYYLLEVKQKYINDQKISIHILWGLIIDL